MYQPIRGRDGHLNYPIGLKKTYLVEDVEALLPIKFRWIPFSSFSGEIENVSANQRSGGHLAFYDRHKNHKLGRERWDIASCQVWWNFVQRFSGEKSKMSQPIRGQTAILFLGRPEKHKLYSERSQVWLNSVQRFHRGSRKYLSHSEARAANFLSDRPKKSQTW